MVCAFSIPSSESCSFPHNPQSSCNFLPISCPNEEFPSVVIVDSLLSCLNSAGSLSVFCVFFFESERYRRYVIAVTQLAISPYLLP